jgi:hypothetical protein
MPIEYFAIWLLLAIAVLAIVLDAVRRWRLARWMRTHDDSDESP